MRNLKKILALVLALVMSLSLMATAGAADAAAGGEQITPAYKTAIDVLKGVEVFRGYEDGSIKPQNTITRAEVATILYRIATGDVKDAQSSIYTDMNASFSDLNQANWARGYVNYCQNAELIVGVGGGKFNPNDKITGYATLAMILRALGYDKNGEFRGSGWEIRTAAKAHELGITKQQVLREIQDLKAQGHYPDITVDEKNYRLNYPAVSKTRRSPSRAFTSRTAKTAPQPEIRSEESRTYVQPSKPYRPAHNAAERYEDWMPLSGGKEVICCPYCGAENQIPAGSDPGRFTCYFCREEL